ncbi:PPE domain-containing protein (plasmid) [Mycolicibacterium crocinum]|uniref:PPE domain-containing protein n=1 Tax=Mycolicibacterium crocinum TaxID=388459 RepID=A0ABY3TZ66_9MYCO|nr:PPE domain-containing protein [Mycolicibacterium crocinum]ULN44704.1 PPE domain-containing protein [Mycolicibacterium crocinum]
MASSANLFIDPDGVRAAGAGLSTASSAVAAPAPAVTPCAADATSVKIAYALSASISELVNATMAVNHKTAQASSRMHSTATTYEDQEHANAASLAAGSPGRATSVPVGDPSTIGGPSLVAPPIPAPGVQPTSGKDIAALMHGGPGPEALETAAQALNAHAAQLDSAAQSVRSARWTSEQNWDSSAADQASTHLAALESTYTRHADQSRGLSRDATVQANNFRQARANIPTPQHFADLEQRLRAAAAHNAQSGGRYTAVVAQLQSELAAAHQQAINSYTTYTAGGQLQAKPLEPGVATTTPPGVPGQPGATPGTEDGSLPATGDAADATGPAGNPLADSAGGGAEMLQTLLPTVLGVVAGAAGGLLGALSGAANQVQQTGTQLVSGLAQGGASALQGLAGGQPGGSDPSLGEGGGPGDLGMGDGGGGGAEPGDTEPASAGDGGLAAAPASAAAAPAVAPAPTVGMGATPTVSSAGGGAGMGAPMGMMPPMMGGPGRGGGSEDDKRLYEEKRLRLTTPPNAEPVKGRVEARESRSERRDKMT